MDLEHSFFPTVSPNSLHFLIILPPLGSEAQCLYYPHAFSITLIAYSIQHSLGDILSPRLTLDSQVQWSVHAAVAIVPNAGVYSLLCGCHVVQGEGDIGRCVPQNLLVSEHPGDPGRRITVHLTVQHHRAALHHLRGDVHPHRAGGIWKKSGKENLTLNDCLWKQIFVLWFW